MNKPKFKNVPNEHLKLQLNQYKRYVWINRAPAIVGIIFAFGVDGGARVLIIKRSKTMKDAPNKFGAPSGYLDFNETGFEGITREIYEETNMYLPDYNPFLLFNNGEQPFFVNTDPTKDKNQNVSLMYVMVYDFKDSQEFFPIEIENFTCRETSKVEWLRIQDFYNSQYDWAFNHDEHIRSALQFYNKSVK